MLKWIITIELDEDVVYADDCTGSAEYIPYLLRVARLVDEKIPGAIVRVLTPGAKGVIGHLVEWETAPRMLVFEGEKLSTLASVARQAGINYG